MERILHYTPSDFAANQRIDSFLRIQGYSGTILKILRQDAQLVLLDGKPSKLVDRITPGASLQIRIPEEDVDDSIAAEPIPLDVIYEDEDILLVNKSSDMAIYPSPSNPSGTLANACRARYGKGFILRCLGRLDRHTSGLVLVAKNRLSACILTDALHSDALIRTYFAAVTGLCPASGVIDAPIGRDDGSILAHCVREDGQRAVTHFKRLDCRAGLSFAQICLDTGRTHQIRVHMRHIGHPLPGDFLYNPDYSRIDRPALHAWQLDFVHPITREPMHFTAPLHEDMLKLL